MHPLAFLTRLLTLLLNVLEGLLALRVLGHLLQLSAANPAVSLLERLTEPFVRPFAGLTPGALPLDWPAVTAMVVYGVCGYFLIRLLHSAIFDDVARRSYAIDEPREE